MTKKILFATAAVLLLVLVGLGLSKNKLSKSPKPQAQMGVQLNATQPSLSVGPGEQGRQRLEKEKETTIQRLREISSIPKPTTAELEELFKIFRQSLAKGEAKPLRLLEPFLGSPSEYSAKLALSAAWAEFNADAAFAWISQEREPDLKQSYYEAAGGALGVKAPQEAIKLAAQLEPGWARKEYLKSVTTGWMSRDFSAAMAWVDALPDGEERNESLVPLIMDLAARTPRQAMTYVVERIPAGDFQDQALANVFAPWLQEDPVAAKTWIAELQSGTLKDELTSKVRQHEEWLAKQAAGPSN
jgi:hypothetical protein